MEYNLGDSPVTSHSWNANRTRKIKCNVLVLIKMLSLNLYVELYRNSTDTK